jgi:hypothetical protein
MENKNTLEWGSFWYSFIQKTGGCGFLNTGRILEAFQMCNNKVMKGKNS